MRTCNLNKKRWRSLSAATFAAVCVTSAALAQTPVFAPGDILVSRTTYTGTAQHGPISRFSPEQRRVYGERKLSERIQQRDSRRIVRRDLADLH